MVTRYDILNQLANSSGRKTVAEIARALGKGTVRHEQQIRVQLNRAYKYRLASRRFERWGLSRGRERMRLGVYTYAITVNGRKRLEWGRKHRASLFTV